jgi:HAD superfamily hydrolase (TIGR01509 family)
MGFGRAPGSLPERAHLIAGPIMFDALMFDLDGTLIDSEKASISSGLEAFRTLGHPVDTPFLHGLIGKDHAASGQLIGAAWPHLDLIRLNQIWQALFIEATAAYLPLKPGAQDLLAAMAHLPLVLVTSSSRKEAHRKLRVAGIADAFREVITVDDVTLAKPAPDPYLLAAQRLNLPPQRCVVFEDSEAGAESANRAGCIVVQVPDILPASGRWAHHVAQDLLIGARMAGLAV